MGLRIKDARGEFTTGAKAVALGLFAATCFGGLAVADLTVERRDYRGEAAAKRAEEDARRQKAIVESAARRLAAW